jgi:hypothetical protein
MKYLLASLVAAGLMGGLATAKEGQPTQHVTAKEIQEVVVTSKKGHSDAEPGKESVLTDKEEKDMVGHCYPGGAV